MTVDWHYTATNDRGIAFGDGCFETIRLCRGKAPFWPQHKQRLFRGLSVLGIHASEQQLDTLMAEAVQKKQDNGIFKLIVTRGVGGRGYSCQQLTTAHYYPRVFPLALPKHEKYETGLKVGVCSFPLASQPRLAGIKHLNRLEQVLARQEVDNNEWDEGLLLDGAGAPVELTAMNVFFRFPEGWWTSDLALCGVAGIGREWVLKQHENILVSEKPPNTLDNVLEAFACNSVAGILPVRKLGQKHLSVGAVTREYQQRWNAIWHD
ncbi:MAG TPA: aminodeoxychorismate lyase [Alcanivoracaceae bacterium]|nr:aminodeoxychorismate lyase [Alcanivoracaceae bacterium]